MVYDKYTGKQIFLKEMIPPSKKPFIFSKEPGRIKNMKLLTSTSKTKNISKFWMIEGFELANYGKPSRGAASYMFMIQAISHSALQPANFERQVQFQKKGKTPTTELNILLKNFFRRKSKLKIYDCRSERYFPEKQAERPQKLRKLFT